MFQFSIEYLIFQLMLLIVTVVVSDIDCCHDGQQVCGARVQAGYQGYPSTANVSIAVHISIRHTYTTQFGTKSHNINTTPRSSHKKQKKQEGKYRFHHLVANVLSKFMNTFYLSFSASPSLNIKVFALSLHTRRQESRQLQIMKIRIHFCCGRLVILLFVVTTHRLSPHQECEHHQSRGYHQNQEEEMKNKNKNYY